MGANTLRIIGGRWRRQLLEFPDIPELRPTQDRIRETLFNWLTPYIKGASCLDLFAGSGALGFEALSRGAKKVTFVDRNPTVIRYIKKTAQTFKIPPEDIEIIQGSCLEKGLSLSFYPYDIIFLDPPFRDKRLPEFAAWLESKAYLNRSALIYVETERQKEPLSLFNGSVLKEGHTTNVSYYLYQR